MRILLLGLTLIAFTPAWAQPGDEEDPDYYPPRREDPYAREPRRQEPGPPPGEAEAGAGELITYENPRYNFTLTYPHALFPRVEKSQNKDGIHVLSADGRAGVRAYGSPAAGVEGFSLRAVYERELRRSGRRVTYQRWGDSFFVVSGYEGDAIFYLKAVVHGRTLLGLEIRHPAAERPRYAAATAQIAQGFRGR